MSLPVITLEGTVVAEPTLRFTPDGTPVASFRVAANHRVKEGDEWVDKESIFVGCSAWREMAENVADSLVKGMAVIVTGRLSEREYETTDGEKRRSIDLNVYNVGPSLKWATATVTKMARRPATPKPAQDTWADTDPQSVPF